MKPLIGITPPYDHYIGAYKLTPFYAKAIEKSGGIPIILPFCDNNETVNEYLKHLDGIVLSGGDNISPDLYGEKTDKKCGYIEHERDKYELMLCLNAVKLNKPILGICRGCQLLAVAFGGSLYQHIENHIQTTDRHIASHSVKILPNTPLFNILKAKTIDVNSFHRQAVKSSGKMKISAVTENNTVEAIFLPNQRFCLGVQWHPERMYSVSFHSKLLFDAFISSCLPS